MVQPFISAYRAIVDFRIPQKPPSIKSIDDLQPAINEIYNSIQQIILSLVRYLGIGTFVNADWPLLAGAPGSLLSSGGLNKVYILASVAISPGQYINVYNNAGVLTARLAKANSLTTQADGFSTGTVATGDVGEFILGEGNNPYLTGLTIGQRYWLSTTLAGGIMTAAPSAAGTIEQYLGMALDTSNLNTRIMYPIQH